MAKPTAETQPIVDLKSIARQTVDDLTAQLRNPKKDEKPLDIVKKCIDSAFSQIEENEYNGLYKALAIWLHPDTMNKKSAELYELLVKRGMLEVPFQHLSTKKTNNIFHDLASSPTAATENLVKNLWSKISQHVDYHNRYFQPFSTIFSIISGIITGTLIVAGVALLIPIAASIAIAYGLKRMLDFITNRLTNDRLENQMDDFRKLPENLKKIENFFIQAKAQHALKMHQQITVEQYKNIWYQEAYTNVEGQFSSVEEYQKQFESRLAPAVGLPKLRMILNAFYEASFAPLPKSLPNKIAAALIVRPTLLIVSTLVLTAATTAELLACLNGILILTSVGALGGAKLVTTAAINMPLYLLDLARGTVSGIKNLFAKRATAKSHDEPAKAGEEKQEQFNKGTSAILRAIGSGAERRSDAAQQVPNLGSGARMYTPSSAESAQEHANPYASVPF